MKTMQDETLGLATLPDHDDGAPRALKPDELTAFKQELEHLAQHAGYNINQRHAAATEVRECLWDGKSPDGRKHADALNGTPAFPFEGASDASVRLADMVINEKVMILVAAALRNRPAVTGLELQHAGLGHKLTTLLHWMLANKLGADYVRELVRLANYVQSDSPAAAVLGVWWDQEPALELKTLTLEELKQLLGETYGLDPQAVAQLEAALYDPARDAETAAGLTELIDHITPARARKVVKELRATGRAQYPCPYLRSDQPVLTAYRLMEDIFVPLNLSDAQRSPYYFLREWLTEAQLRARIVTHRYAADWVEEALEHEGETAFDLYQRTADGGLVQTEVNQETTEDRRGRYEIWTVLYRAVSEDNIPGLYYVTFHNDVEEAAHDRRLLEFAHGQYPFTWFAREYSSNRLLEARGLPELLAGEQMTQKLLVDSFNDHVSLSTVPPIKVPASRAKLKLVIGPLKKIEEKRPGEIEFMQPPAYPAANQVAFDESQRRVDEYFGRLTERVPATLAQLHMQHEAMLFLSSLTAALTQMLQLCQQFISDEELQLICGDDDVPIARSRAEIQGKFRVELTFDPRHLDMEYVKQLAEIIKNFFVPMDTENTIMRNELLSFLFGAVNPMLAKRTMRPTQAAQANEIEDEKRNASLILNNYEPPMLAEGQNFALRLDTLLTKAETDPEYLQKMTPMAHEIYTARLKQLFHQVQQQQNAITGRAVGQPVFGDPQMLQLENRLARVTGGKTSNGGRGQ